MILTGLAILLGGAVAAEGALLVRDKTRREPWEPSILDALRRDDTGWLLTGQLAVPKDTLRGICDNPWSLDRYIRKKAEENNIDCNHWSIDWCYGCVRKRTGEQIRAGWNRSPARDKALVFFYTEPPRPKPLPKPETKPLIELWSEKDQIEQALAFMEHDTCFWLAADFSGGHNLRDRDVEPFWMKDAKVPVLRFFRDKVELADTSTRLATHVDLQYDASRKRKFRVSPCHAENPSYYDTLADARAAIRKHLEQAFGPALVDNPYFVFDMGLATMRPQTIVRATTDESLVKEIPDDRFTQALHTLRRVGLTVEEFQQGMHTMIDLNMFGGSNDTILSGPNGSIRLTLQQKLALMRL